MHVMEHKAGEEELEASLASVALDTFEGGESTLVELKLLGVGALLGSQA